MDHIPSCSDHVAHPPVEVPLLCDARHQYDDLGFLSYPKRLHIDIDRLRHDRFPTLRLRDAGRFVQAWLWFGLLCEALQMPAEEFRLWKTERARCFLQERGGRRFVSTKHLYASLAAAVASRTYDEEQQARVTAYVMAAADFANTALLTLSLQSLHRQDDTHGSTASDIPFVILSVQVLVDTLSATLSVMLRHRLPFPPAVQVRWGADLVDSWLRRAGWCSSEVERLPRDVRFRYHLSFYRHEECDDGQGHTRTVEESQIRPVHTHDNCACRMEGARASDVESAVEGGKIPLFSLVEIDCGGRELAMQTVVLDLTTPPPPEYVAITHVRTAGLGNGCHNALPFCQLSRIQSLVNQLRRGTPAGTPVPFWIDALCLPINSWSRKPALHSVFAIIQRAAAVLVLDPALFKHSFSSAQEALIRIRYSAWKKRVWTVWEGMLTQPQSLHFCFANGTFSLEQLIADYSAIASEPTRQLSLVMPEPPEPPRPGPLWADPGGLTTVAIYFVEDIMLGSQFLKQTPSRGAEWPWFDGNKLYQILRLACLSPSKFRYFVEMDESRLFVAVQTALFRVYDGFPPRTMPPTLLEPIEHVMGRLKNMDQAVPLQQAAAARVLELSTSV